MTLYIRVTATRYHNVVTLVTCAGQPRYTWYDGDSRALAFRAVQQLRALNYCGDADPCVAARSTSGGNGDSRYLMAIGRFDNRERYGG